MSAPGTPAPLTTATALEASSSWGLRAVTYAMLTNTYTKVTTGMEMKMARGRFLGESHKSVAAVGFFRQR